MLLNFLESTVLLSTGLLAGSTFYISFVEISARKTANDYNQLLNWQQVFPSAGKLLRAIGTVIIPFMILTGFLSDTWLWFLSAFLLFALIPFTLIKIAPTNDKLFALKLDEASETTSKLIRSWDSLHHVRSIIAISAFFVTTLAM